MSSFIQPADYPLHLPAPQVRRALRLPLPRRQLRRAVSQARAERLPEQFRGERRVLVENRRYVDRSARSDGADPGRGAGRIASTGGTAVGTYSATEDGSVDGEPGVLLHAGESRHEGSGERAESAAILDGAGIHV